MAFISSVVQWYRPSYVLTSSFIAPRTALRNSTAPARRLVPMATMASDKKPEEMTDPDWQEVLTKEQYYILRQKGTEPAGSGEYDKFQPPSGHFKCAACGNPLYSAQSKFDSGCGWPAFDKCYKGSIQTEVDDSWGMRRVEIMCGRCGGHLGHSFNGERFTETNERHCVNSISVKYDKDEPQLEEAALM